MFLGNQVVIICHDFFDNFQQNLKFYQKIAQYYTNTKFLLFNYPGQMFTMFNKNKTFTNEELSSLLDGFLHFLDDNNQINIENDSFMFVGIGYGGYILSHYCNSS